MKEKTTKTLLFAVVLALSGITASAQGLGGLLNKVKKTSEKVEKVLGNTTVTPAAQKEPTVNGNTALALNNGITISNPLAEVMEIVPVGLYGMSTSENFGNCYLVLKVKMLLPESKTNFGSVGSERMMAVDTNGKTYIVDAGGSYPHETPEGIMVNVALNENGLMFEGVKKNVSTMQMVKFGVYIDFKTKGYVTLRNVPIFWDKSPE